MKKILKISGEIEDIRSVNPSGKFTLSELSEILGVDEIDIISLDNGVLAVANRGRPLGFAKNHLASAIAGQEVYGVALMCKAEDLEN